MKRRAAALQKDAYQRHIGRAGENQRNRQGQLHALAGGIGARFHGPNIRRFYA
jgi:hypothetical protein